MTRMFAVLITIAGIVISGLASAATPKQLKWDDLIPQAAPLEDPLTALTADQTIDFDILATFRQYGPAERTPENSRQFEDARLAQESLLKQGVDIEGTFEKYQKWQVEKEKRDNALVNQLNGETIRIAGYLLPLDFSDKGASEFLLVPYVGACIHVPPPPPNQLVYVKLEKTYMVQGLFEPVFVTGEMKTKRSERLLSLADGDSNVPVGYTLSGQKIEPYVQE